MEYLSKEYFRAKAQGCLADAAEAKANGNEALYESLLLAAAIYMEGEGNV